jgi:microcystin degradation protein MlrC
MKVFAAGVATESNTFCPVPTTLDDFLIQRGKDVLAGRVGYPSFDLSRTWGALANARGAEFVFSLMAWAPPGGITVTAAYERLRDEVMNDLRAAMPVDVVLLMLHGAMQAPGYEDCEQDLLERVRGIVGPAVVIAVELDLHCHLHADKIAPADIVITYKEYPHVDINDRAQEVFDLAVAAKLGHIQPTMALFDCQMIGSYPTSRQPLRGFVDAMIEMERTERVLSVSFGHGFRCADVPYAGAKILVVTDGSQALADKLARDLGLQVYGMRREIGFESLSLPLEAALSKALASSRRPVVVADQSDNVGGGAPGDATYALRWLLDHAAEDVAMAIFYDPEVVRIARRAGPGAHLAVRLGGKMGPCSGDPVDLDVCVLSAIDGYSHLWSQQSGEPVAHPAGDVVALRADGIDLVVSSERCQCFSPAIFDDLGIESKRKRLLVPKSNQHFYTAFSAIAGEVIYMAGPGAVPPDPRQIPYRRLDRSRLYPWVDDPLSGHPALRV